MWECWSCVGPGHTLTSPLCLPLLMSFVNLMFLIIALGVIWSHMTMTNACNSKGKQRKKRDKVTVIEKGLGDGKE